jgi:glycosyltransferase involved in cell wall biosynthesis
MHILFLLPDFPYPPITGGRLKVYNELEYLSELHQCDILCFGKPDAAQRNELASALPKVRVLESVPPPSLAYKGVCMMWSLIRALPPSLSAFSSRNYASAVRNCLATGGYDVVHYDIINMAQYLPLGSKLPSVHSPNDATSLVYFRAAEYAAWSLRKIKLLITAFLLRRFERQMYPLFTKVHVVSATDATYLKLLNPSIDISTISNSINGEFLVKIQNKENHAPELGLKIICTGNLGNHQIAEGVEEFLQNAFPSILKKMPNAQFVILGQNVSSTLLKKIKNSTNVELLTWVDNYRSFLTEASVVLVPDIAGPPGAKTRTLQAIGLGLAVVGTKNAFEGIPFIDGEHGLMYKTMSECSELILKLLSNKRLREMLGENAHRLAVEKFALSAIGPIYESLYMDAISKYRSLMFNS